MRIIDADALKKSMTDYEEECGDIIPKKYFDFIDNAPTIDLTPTINVNIPEETKQKLIEELQKPHKLLVLPETEVTFLRPQGECKTCRHRDPEDKKCDCGGQERQGAFFPVRDNYYCKYYEKGGAE